MPIIRSSYFERRMMQFCARRPSMTDSSLTFRVLTQRSSMEPVSFCRAETTGCSSKPPPQGGDNRHLRKQAATSVLQLSSRRKLTSWLCLNSESASFEGRLRPNAVWSIVPIYRRRHPKCALLLPNIMCASWVHFAFFSIPEFFGVLLLLPFFWTVLYCHRTVIWQLNASYIKIFTG